MTISSLLCKVGHSIFRQLCVKKSPLDWQLPRASTGRPWFCVMWPVLLPKMIFTDKDLLSAQRRSSIAIPYVTWLQAYSPSWLPSFELVPLCPKTSWDEASGQGRTITFLCLEPVVLLRTHFGTQGRVLVTHISLNPSKHFTMGEKARNEQNFF